MTIVEINGERLEVEIHKDPDSDYGMTFKKYPGCFPLGGTIDELLSDATDALREYREITGESTMMKIQARQDAMKFGVKVLVEYYEDKDGAPEECVHCKTPTAMVLVSATFFLRLCPYCVAGRSKDINHIQLDEA